MTNEEIRQRFVEAWKLCTIKRGTAKEFCEKYNIDHSNFAKMINNRYSRELRLNWLACFCEEFNVSTDYILLGRGDVFRENTDALKAE